jgi:ABC-type multidrug transport system ATPase subunit
MSAIRTLAVAEGMIVLATIHQPSLETLAQFTNLLMLAEGKTCYSGPVYDLEGFFERWGRPVGRFVCIRFTVPFSPPLIPRPSTRRPSMR